MGHSQGKFGAVEKSDEGKALERVKDVLLHELEPLKVLDYMLENSWVTQKEHQWVKSGKSRREKSQRLYDCLVKHLPQGLNLFYFALLATTNKYLAKKLNQLWYQPQKLPKTVPAISLTCTEVGTSDTETQRGNLTLVAVEIREMKGRTRRDYLACMISVLDNDKKRCKAADQILKMTSHLMSGFSKSPLVIELKPCKSLLQPFPQNQAEYMKKIVGEILSHATFSNAVADQSDEVVTEYTPRYQYDKDGESQTATEALQRNMEQLQEELEPTIIIQTWPCLTEKEKQDICQRGQRRAMVARLIEIVINKGNAVAIQFILMLLENNSFSEMAKTMFSHCFSGQPHDVLMEKYEYLVDELSPDDLARRLAEEQLLPGDFIRSKIWKSTMGYRSLQAKMILQIMLSMEAMDAMKVCEILRKEGYNLPETG